MIFFDSASNLGSSPSVAFLVVHYHGNSFLHQRFANGAGEWWCSEMNPGPKERENSNSDAPSHAP